MYLGRQEGEIMEGYKDVFMRCIASLHMFKLGGCGVDSGKLGKGSKRSGQGRDTKATHILALSDVS